MVAWLSGNALVAINKLIYVNTWMGDCLRAGTPSRYVTSHLDQLSLPSIRQGSFPAGTPGNGVPKVIFTVGTAFPGIQ